MAESSGDDFLADLDAELSTAKTGGCKYCEEVRLKRSDIDAKIEARLAANPKLKAWTAISRVLQRHGMPGVTRSVVMGHFTGDRERHGRE